jgi:hypothetical protein
MDINDLQLYFNKFVDFMVELHDFLHEFANYCVDNHMII